MDLSEMIIGLLAQRRLTLAVAESCTGGLLMSELVGAPGCSAVLLEGLCTYSNESKTRRLGVSVQLLEAHGAVSEEVAIAMAECVARTSGADIGLSTTGIAGPGGGTDEKPVGLVYIGIYINGHTSISKLNLTGTRNEIRRQAVDALLEKVIYELKKI